MTNCLLSRISTPSRRITALSASWRIRAGTFGRRWVEDLEPRQNVYARAASGFAPHFPDERPQYSEAKSERIKREYPIELFALST